MGVFKHPEGVTVYDEDTILLTDTRRIFKVKVSTGEVTKLAGQNNNDTKLINGPGIITTFNTPCGMCWDLREGGRKYLYVADGGNHVIRRLEFIDPDNVVVTTFAGANNVFNKDLKDGTRSTALFITPRYIAFDKQGNLYVCDKNNIRVIYDVAPPLSRISFDYKNLWNNTEKLKCSRNTLYYNSHPLCFEILSCRITKYAFVVLNFLT